MMTGIACVTVKRSRIVEAVLETRAMELHRVPAVVKDAMRTEWEKGADSLSPGRCWSIAPAAAP